MKMRFSRITKMKTKIILKMQIFAFLIFCLLTSSCVHKKNYHNYLTEKFEIKHSDSIHKYWKPTKSYMDKEKSQEEYKLAFDHCEKLLNILKPNFAFIFSVQNIMLNCMLERGFEYTTEEIMVVH